MTFRWNMWRRQTSRPGIKALKSLNIRFYFSYGVVIKAKRTTNILRNMSSV